MCLLTVEYCAGQGVGPDLPVGGALLQGPGLPGVALLQGAGVHLGRERGREGGARREDRPGECLESAAPGGCT